VNKFYEKADKLHKVAEQVGSSDDAKKAAARADKDLNVAEEKMEQALGLAKGWVLETQYKTQQAQEEAKEEAADEADEKTEKAEDAEYKTQQAQEEAKEEAEDEADEKMEDEADAKEEDEDDQMDQQLNEQAPDANMYTAQDELAMRKALDKLEKRVQVLKAKAALPGAHPQEKHMCSMAAICLS